MKSTDLVNWLARCDGDGLIEAEAGAVVSVRIHVSQHRHKELGLLSL